MNLYNKDIEQRQYTRAMMAALGLVLTAGVIIGNLLF